MCMVLSSEGVRLNKMTLGANKNVKTRRMESFGCTGPRSEAQMVVNGRRYLSPVTEFGRV